MSKTRIVFAHGEIAFGARVLVRGIRAELADEATANATAGNRPIWAGPGKHFADGESLTVTMDEALGQRDLHAIAAGPIMDSNALYLPAGKLSMAEFRERQAEMLSGEPA